jgi:uncharacterized protein (UPF0254 family)
MQRFLAPICLILCLAMLVTGFALLATDPPEPNVQLHRARATRDEAYEEVLERELQRRIWMRRGVIGGLFVGAFALGVGAFCSIGDARR